MVDLPCLVFPLDTGTGKDLQNLSSPHFLFPFEHFDWFATGTEKGLKCGLGCMTTSKVPRGRLMVDLPCLGTSSIWIRRALPLLSRVKTLRIESRLVVQHAHL